MKLMGDQSNRVMGPQRGFAMAEIWGVCLILKVFFLEPKKEKSGN